MTIGEFQKLAVRGLRRRDTPVYAGDHVLVQILESYAVANGTWIIEGDDIYYPINTSKVECDRDRDTCVITKADVQIPNVDGDDNAYHLGLSSETFEVISWSRDEIIARAFESLAPSCRTTLLTLNKSANEVYQITRNTNKKGCDDEDRFLYLPPLDSPRITRLVDGFDTTRAYWKKRQEQTLEFLNSAMRESPLWKTLNPAAQQQIP